VLKSLAEHSERPRILTIEAAALDLAQEQPVSEPQIGQDRPVSVNQGESLKSAVDHYQKVLIDDALVRHQGKWAQVARELSVDRANLSRLAKRLGIR
jgi:anaerobic nitric oxide reductase transcription regulator